jgi:hypothetical protein
VKKLLIFTILMASMVFVVPASEAKATDNTNLSGSTELQQRRGRLYEQRRRDQIRYNLGNNRRTRTVYRSTLVRRGYRLYRYTYRITYHRNGRVTRRLVSRSRVR